MYGIIRFQRAINKQDGGQFIEHRRQFDFLHTLNTTVYLLHLLNRRPLDEGLSKMSEPSTNHSAVKKKNKKRKKKTKGQQAEGTANGQQDHTENMPKVC